MVRERSACPEPSTFTEQERYTLDSRNASTISTSDIDEVEFLLKKLLLFSDKETAERSRRLISRLKDLQATVEDAETLISVLNKASVSLEKTGFVDWAQLEHVFPLPPAKKSPTKTSQKSIVSNRANFPEYPLPVEWAPTFDVTVGTILDPFSSLAFGFEWNSLALPRSGWSQQLDLCDFLFVESAWSGNNGDWQYCLTGSKGPKEDFITLMAEARRRNIPTVFWNKEDPPHYDDFLETAKLFDYVFTSDVNKVPDYTHDLGHTRVGVLPFAAQPKVHNPIEVHGIKRNREIAFGGMYFSHKYPERRAQMDYLLPAASNFKLDIFSRFYELSERFRFPEPFDSYVRGELNYEQMLAAHHAYKVFLNVNSVTSSPSMCARRIFEVLASGAAVVSAPSPAIPNYFSKDLVPTPKDEEETRHAIRGLLRNGGYRERQVHKAQRLIWREHTYSHRVERVLEATGHLPEQGDPDPVTVMAPTIRPAQIENILQNVARQERAEPKLLLMTHGFSVNRAEIIARARDLGIEHIEILEAGKEHTLGANLNRMVLHAEDGLLTKLDDDDYYGPNYLEDLIAAKKFSGADVVGKAATYVYFEARSALVLTYEADEHRFVDFVRGPTLTASRSVFLDNPFPDSTISEDSTFLRRVRSGGGKIYSADKYNFYLYRSSDSTAHTYRATEEQMFGSGDVVSFGSPTDYVTV